MILTSTFYVSPRNYAVIILLCFFMLDSKLLLMDLNYLSINQDFDYMVVGHRYSCVVCGAGSPRAGLSWFTLLCSNFQMTYSFCSFPWFLLNIQSSVVVLKHLKSFVCYLGFFILFSVFYFLLFLLLVLLHFLWRSFISS